MERRRDRAEDGISRRRLLAAGGAGVAGLAGCVGSATTDIPSLNPGEPDAIPHGGVLTIGIPEPPAGTNPLAVAPVDAFSLTELVYATGTVVDPVEFGVHPNVYTDWYAADVEKPGANPTIEINVRSGLTFTDGTPLTVEDVLFTYRYLLEHEPEEYAAAVEPIASVERASSYKWDVSLALSRPASTYDSVQLGVPILPKHVWEDVDDPESYRPTENGGPVGVGPGTITTYEPDATIEVAFPVEYALGDLDWRRESESVLDGGPFLDGVRYRVYDGESRLEDAFRRGEIDAIHGSYEPSAIEPVLDDGDRNTVAGSDEAYTALAFNLRHPPLDDCPFRQVLGFAFDERYWTQNLNDGHLIAGDFVTPPGYTAVRPEYVPSALPKAPDQPFLTGPSTEAFAFRAAASGSRRVDIETIRSFLTEGVVIDGTEDTYAGKHYPGSITGVSPSQTESRHEYAFGPVESDVLGDAETERELRVNGETIPDRGDGPLVLLSHPRDEKPKEAAMLRRYARTLRRIGVPVELTEAPSKALRERVFRREAFDIVPIETEPVSEFVIESLYRRFHSDNADDHSAEADAAGNPDAFRRNASGYGLFEEATADGRIERGLREMNVESRNDLLRRTVEHIYLDCPVIVASYATLRWPVDREGFEGFVEDIPAPGSTYLPSQLLQTYER